MDPNTRYTVFVMQSGVDPKDIYIAQTTKDPQEVVAQYNAVENSKTLPKPLGKMLPLTLRLDLAGSDNVFASQSEAIEYRKMLSESYEKQTFKYYLRSKRSFFFGRKKSVKDKQTGKYTLVIDPSQLKVNDTRGGSISGVDKDAFSYGRKKSAEWNDEAAAKLEIAIKEKVARKRKDDIDFQ